ncbi:hypothetical protein PCANC_05351 [Puccinia coronata f. sp. avenae]|uniref:Uncharacterized protein n=1 Tax=Puccinia coronata f. sp. avenae TaxID=200324 RepID=A0A2N5VXF1_9BASI|nr:hypothetical protein PCASD_09388 [Puccinia coronata f. sp. avenae]PLW54660.1 hypothetical protein PCANC_05351 [Puccinia coronata f. sp. avenae]
MQFISLASFLFAAIFGVVVCVATDDNPVVFRCNANKDQPHGFCSQYQPSADTDKKGAYLMLKAIDVTPAKGEKGLTCKDLNAQNNWCCPKSFKYKEGKIWERSEIEVCTQTAGIPPPTTK